MNEGTGTVVLEGTTTVTHNKASYGGGAYNDAGSTLTLLDSTTISHNTATVDGGGIYNLGTLSIAATAVVAHNRPDNIAP